MPGLPEPSMMSPPRMSSSSMLGLLGVVGSISVRRTDSPGVAACQRGLESALAMRRSLDDARPSRLPRIRHDAGLGGDRDIAEGVVRGVDDARLIGTNARTVLSR